jgi:hypothetical protein
LSTSLFGAKDALLDFRQLHGIEDDKHMIHNIDGGGAWFRKVREINVDRSRYLSVLANNASMREVLMPGTQRTRGNVHALQAHWQKLEGTQTRQTEWREGLDVYSDVKGRQPFNRSNWRTVISEAPSHIPWHL